MASSNVLSFDEWKDKENECIELIYPSKGIKTIPTSIANFQCLQVLDFSRNQIFQIPAALSRLQVLKHLNLSHNSISLVNLPQMQNLKQIDLSYNKIKTLGEQSFINITAIEIIDLSSNQINKIADTTFLPLHHLESLQINDNQIIEFPSSIFKIKTLTNLNLQNNKINELQFVSCKESLNIQIDGNPLVKNLLKSQTLKINTNLLVNNNNSQNSPNKKKEKRNSFETLKLPQSTQSRSKSMSDFTPPNGTLSPRKKLEVKFKGISKSDKIQTEKVVKKRFLADQKSKQEVIKILRNAKELFDNEIEENEEISSENYQIISKSLKKSISLLSKKKRETDATVRKLKHGTRTNSLPSINKDLIHLNKSSRFSPRISKLKPLGSPKLNQEIVKKPEIPDSVEIVENFADISKNSPTFSRISKIRRGNTNQDIFIHVIDKDIELAFCMEMIDGKPEKILVGGPILSIFRYLMYHDRSKCIFIPKIKSIKHLRGIKTFHSKYL